MIKYKSRQPYPDGTKLLAIHTLIYRTRGDLKLVLYGTSLPIPDTSIFETITEKKEDECGVPGEITLDPNNSNNTKITINEGREAVEIIAC